MTSQADLPSKEDQMTLDGALDPATIRRHEQAAQIRMAWMAFRAAEDEAQSLFDVAKSTHAEARYSANRATDEAYHIQMKTAVAKRDIALQEAYRRYRQAKATILSTEEA